MPSIIPSSGTAPGPVNFTTGQSFVDSYTLAAGSYLYASTIWWMFQGTGNTNTFINHGTIFYDVALHPSEYSYDWTYVVANASAVQNDGKVVVIIDLPPGPGIYVKQATVFADIRDSSTNSGQIYAISHYGNTKVFESSYQATITNSGLLAAQAFDGWSAHTIYLRNGGHVINQAGGKILAEADDATAIYFGGSGQIENAGLIEAASTSIVNSIGIRSTGNFTNVAQIINIGTIRADIAIYGDDLSGTTTTSMVVQQVTNQTGGLIDGRIELNNGDDMVTNRGAINGDVSMGEGNDVVDTNGGTLNGIVELFWGSDTFIGSAGADRVSGDDGDDTLTGNGGNDLFFGGANDDVLTGGAGNDGLFGEYGNDRIVTQAADVAEGGAGDDRIEIGDYAFARVDGGDGFDTLVLPSGARKLDLSAALAIGRITNFEQIELTGSKELVVRSGDIANITGGGSQLMIDATSTDKVDLLGTWTAGANQSIGGTIYKTYSSNGVTVLVEQVATVVLGGSPPAGVTGLDAIASGAAAPSPDGSLGLGYTPNDLYLVAHEISQSVVINPEETWWNAVGGSVLMTYNPGLSVTNHGQILSYNETTSGGTLAIDGPNLQNIVNDGAISAISTNTNGTYIPGLGYSGDATTAIRGVYQINNDGLIEAQANFGSAVAISWITWLVNNGDIVAYSENGGAFAVQWANHFENYGNIIAAGAVQAVAAELIYADYSNDGYVEATTFGPNAQQSIGLFLNFGTGWSASVGFTNNGVVVADIAIKANVGFASSSYVFTLSNNGELHGDVLLGAAKDKVVNAGLITGTTNLGAGNDIFDGTAGVQGVVRGADGNDTLTGGIQGDILDGGMGNDVLNGGAGIDAASYGDATAGVTVNLAIAGAQNTIGAGTDTLSNFENLTGSAFNDVLTGGGGANLLQGGGGSDILSGSAGADSLTGGSGNDAFQDSKSGLNGDTITDFALGDKIIITDATLAGFTFNLTGNTLTYNGGSLTLQGTLTGQLVASAAAGGGVQLSLQVNPTEGDDTLTGTELADEVNGLGGNDTLNGLGGNDDLIGGAGNDTIDGGLGIDTASYDDIFHPDGVTVSLAVAGPQNTGAGGTDTLIEIENVIGSGFNDRLTGNAGANALVGGMGADVLNGGGGIDHLNGEFGSDLYIIGSSSDHTAAEVSDNGPDGIDEVRFAAAVAGTLTLFAGDTGIEQVVAGNGTDPFALADTSATTALNINASAVQNALTMTGNAGDNTLTATAFNDLLNGGWGVDRLYGNGGNDWLDGGVGADKLFGGAGDDTYIVDNASDIVVENAGEGTDHVWASVSHTLRDNVENILLTGIYSIYATGNALNNQMTGNSGSNKLYGLGGDDTLIGGDGSDTLDGGVGADQMVGGAGNENYYVDDAGDQTIEEMNQGIDTVRTTIDHTLSANIENMVLLGTANLNGTGNALNNVMTGNAGDNHFIGDAGVDQLKGLGGNDTLDGGIGSDRLYGGTGHDVYIVDTTGDLIFENAGEGWDSVESSVTYILAANVENLNLTGSANINGTGNELDNSINGNDGANILTGELGRDHLFGEGGADVLKAGDGDDWLEGGWGRDRFYGGAGADLFLFVNGDFAGVTSSTCDQIHDFSQAEGDRIELSLVDANINVDGIDPFSFLGTAAFTGTAGELRYQQISGNTYVQGDTDGDGTADFWIRLDGLHMLGQSDFVL